MKADEIQHLDALVQIEELEEKVAPGLLSGKGGHRHKMRPEHQHHHLERTVVFAE